jgi:hypothetical protein
LLDRALQIDPAFAAALLPGIVQLDPVWINKVVPAVIGAFPADTIVRLVNALAPGLSKVNPDLLVALLPIVNTISLETWSKMIEMLNMFTISQVRLQTGCAAAVGASLAEHVLLCSHAMPCQHAWQACGTVSDTKAG